MENEKYTLEKFDELRKKGYRPGIVCVFIKDKKILFFYKKEYNLWLLPQGGIENKETIPEAIARNMPEEVGPTLTNSCRPEFEIVHEDTITFTKAKLGVKDLKLDDGTEVEMLGKHYYFCLLYPEIEEINIEETEFDEYFWMTFEEAKFINDQIYQESKKQMVDKLLNVLKVKELL